MSGVKPVSGSPSGTQTNAPDEITVQKNGAKLDDIAKDIGIPVSELIKANPKISPKAALKQGQHIQYPPDMLVGPKENTLEDVEKRFGMNPGTLEKANPDLKGKQLREGQAFKFPKDFFDPKATGEPKRGVKEKPTISSSGGPGQITKGDGAGVYRPPTVKIGGREIPVPDVIILDGPRPGVGGTNSNYDGTGESNTARRKQEQDSVSNTRVKDDRDLDKDQIKKLDDDKKKGSQDAADDQIRKGNQKNPGNKPNIKEEAAEISRKLKEDMLKRQAQEAAEFIRRGGR
jgi:LysM repeat protein